jgi:hypothetical protein
VSAIEPADGNEKSWGMSPCDTPDELARLRESGYCLAGDGRAEGRDTVGPDDRRDADDGAMTGVGPQEAEDVAPEVAEDDGAEAAQVAVESELWPFKKPDRISREDGAGLLRPAANCNRLG